MGFENPRDSPKTEQPKEGLPQVTENVRDSGQTFVFGRSNAGEQVDEKAAMQIPTVYACVRLLAESIAALPPLPGRTCPAWHTAHRADVLQDTTSGLSANVCCIHALLLAGWLLGGEAGASHSRTGRLPPAPGSRDDGMVSLVCTAFYFSFPIEI